LPEVLEGQLPGGKGVEQDLPVGLTHRPSLCFR
jgi:hypothetical protein